MARKKLEVFETAEEMLDILKDSTSRNSYKLHQFAKLKKLNIDAKVGALNYRIVYAIQNPKRTLFTLEFNEAKWRVKANLYHFNQYKEILDEESIEIKKGMLATRSCTSCNPKCIKGSTFYFNDKEYCTCIGSGHYFYELNNKEIDNLIELIDKERMQLLLL